MNSKEKRAVPEFIVTIEGDILGEDNPENREIVRRIHACVNACTELTTDDLEKGIVKDMQRVIGQIIPVLEQQQIADVDVEEEALAAN